MQTTKKNREPHYKKAYEIVKQMGYKKDFLTFVLTLTNLPLPNVERGALDLHKAILKVAPKKGFVLPGHNYTGPGNPLDSQLSYDPETGQILEVYQLPSGKTDAVAMQHDVD